MPSDKAKKREKSSPALKTDREKIEEYLEETSKVGKPHKTKWTKKPAKGKVKVKKKAKKGDTIAKIAEEQGVTTQALLRANPELKLLRAGAVLNIPSPPPVVPLRKAGAPVAPAYVSAGAQKRVEEFGPAPAAQPARIPTPSGMIPAPLPVMPYGAPPAYTSAGARRRVEEGGPASTPTLPEYIAGRMTQTPGAGIPLRPAVSPTAGYTSQGARTRVEEMAPAPRITPATTQYQGVVNRRFTAEEMAEVHSINISEGRFPDFINAESFRLLLDAGYTDLLLNYQQDRYGNWVLLEGGEMPAEAGAGGGGGGYGLRSSYSYGGGGGYGRRGYGGGGGGGYGAGGQAAGGGFARGPYSPETGAKLQRGGRVYFSDFGPVTWRI